MLIKKSINDEKYIKMFTIKNQNYRRQVRMMWVKAAPRLEYKKLYSKENNRSTEATFPIAPFIDKAKPGRMWRFVTNWNNEIELRTEQADIINKIWDNRTWLICMRTWAGKSITIAKIVDHFNEPTLIATHSTTCLNDLKNTFKKCLWIEVWEFSWKKKDIKEITVTTHKSLANRDNLQYFKSKFAFIIVDECDTGFTDNMYYVLNNIDAEWIFWFTGTVWTKEISAKDMELIYWPLIQSDKVENNWYQLLPEIWSIKYDNGLEYPYTEFNELKEMLCNDEIRLEYICKFVHRCFELNQIKFWLALFSRKEKESQMFYKKFHEMYPWFPIANIDWDTKIADDDREKEIIKARWYWLICWTTGKLWRWADIPWLDWVFLLSAVKFENSVAQAVWRWLRSYPGKTKCILYDRCDRPVLKSQYYERVKAYRKHYGRDVAKENDYHMFTNKLYTDGKDK